MIRVLITADLHYNHAKSRPVAEDLIDRMNAAGGDVLLVVGDTAAADGDALERCLERFRFSGPRLFVPGNHELWTAGDDSYAVFSEVLPRRVRACGWHWLQTEPFRIGAIGFAGSLGWYDYAFAETYLGIPSRFYERKVSPGAAERLSEYAALLEPADDIGPIAREVIARWNDGKFVKLHRRDEAFLDELLQALRGQLDSLADAGTVIAAVHHLPFRELLPPARIPQWDFGKAFLGSPKLGELLLQYSNVRHLFCGHSHYRAEAHIGHIRALNIGSGYGHKTFEVLEVSS